MAVTAQQPRNSGGGSVAFAGVNVVPMGRPGVLQAQAVVVSGGRIVYVGQPTAAALKREAARNVVQRYVALDLSSFDPGTYRLVVTVSRGGGSTAEASRLISILARPR